MIKQHFRGYDSPQKTGNRMVAESLKYYLKINIENTFREDNIEEKLNSLFSETDNTNPFNEKETNFLVEKINQLKLIDITVNDGNLLIKVLDKLVFLLSKLEPLNENNLGQNKINNERKSYLIQNCLYGVGSQPAAVQMARLELLVYCNSSPVPKTNLITAKVLKRLPESQYMTINKIELNSYDTNRPINWFDPEYMFGIENKNIKIQKNWKLFSITWRTYNSYYREEDLSITLKGQDPVLLNLDERNLIADILAERIRMKKYRALVLNVLQDHVHLLLSAEENEVAKIIDDLKGYSSCIFHRVLKNYPDHLHKLWARKFKTDFIEDNLKAKKVIEEIKNNHMKHSILPINIKTISSMLTPLKKAFEDETVITGFDIVIGTPPYVNTEIQKNEKEKLIEQYGFAENLYVRFFSRGLELLKSEGAISFISLYPENLDRQIENLEIKNQICGE